MEEVTGLSSQLPGGICVKFNWQVVSASARYFCDEAGMFPASPSEQHGSHLHVFLERGSSADPVLIKY